MPRKSIFTFTFKLQKVAKTILLIIAFVAVFLGSTLFGDTAGQIIRYSAISLGVTWLSVYITILIGIGPIGTAPKWSAKKSFVLISIVQIAFALFFAGITAAMGALIGSAIALLSLRRVL